MTRVSMESVDKPRLLKNLPFVDEILPEAQVNNHGQDKSTGIDVVHQAWQNRLLQTLRVAAKLFMSSRHLGR